MADDDLVTGLMKRALGSAASTAGSKAGGIAVALVMDFLGLDANEAAKTQAELVAIKSELDAMDTKLTAILNQIKWQSATQNFDTIAANVQTYLARIAGHLGDTDSLARDSGLRKYIQSAQPSIGTLDSALTDIHNKITGAGGIVGLGQKSLFATLIETQWTAFADQPVAKAYGALLEIYRHAAQFQRVAASILATYYTVTGDPASADGVKSDIEPRLKAQYETFLKAVPPVLLLDAMENPNVSIPFEELRIEPKCVQISDEHLAPADTPDPQLSWALERQGNPHPGWELVQFYFYRACESDELVETEDVTGLGAHGGLNKVTTATARFVKMVMQSQATAPLRFGLGTTETVDRFRLSLNDGSTLGYLDRGDAGMTFELTAAKPTASNGYVELKGVKALPGVGKPVLRAWSRAFSNSPSGEGRFQPGFRVRYRVKHVNRLGESDKSDWAAAPNFNQDSDGYFDGNGSYYFPQIALAVDPSGRTEAYRIFRQFKGGPEEEIFVGSYSRDPQNNDIVIFDDFTP